MSRGRWLWGVAGGGLVAFWVACAWAIYWSWGVKDRRAGRPSDRPGFFDHRRSEVQGKGDPTTNFPPTTVAQPVPRPTEMPWSPETTRKIEILDEILRSRNDNDPRMDQELRDLSTEAQAALRAKYFRVPMENRNSRGTVVFLLARRHPIGVENLEFLKDVLAEPDCLSLIDCSKSSFDRRENPHETGEMGLDVTLSYPQRMALRMIERSLRDQASWTSAEREATSAALQAGRASSNSWVARRSAEFLSRIK